MTIVPHEQISDEHVTLQIVRGSNAKSDAGTSRLAERVVKIHFRRELERHVLTVRCEGDNANGRESKNSNRVSGLISCSLTRVIKCHTERCWQA